VRAGEIGGVTFIEFMFFVFGACVGYGLAFWFRLGWWSPVVALVAGIAFAAGSI